MNTCNLYIVDPILKRASDTLYNILGLIIEFYRALIGFYCTMFLFGFAGLGVITGVFELLSKSPSYLSTLVLFAFCAGVFLSRVFRIFIWTFLATCVPWVGLITFALINIFGVNPEHNYSSPVASFTLGAAFLLPPLMASLFMTQQINKKSNQIVQSTLPRVVTDDSR
jgi:hypothetical protein